MNIDELTTEFPRFARLIAGRKVSASESLEGAPLEDGPVCLIPTSQGPAMLIDLAVLESALAGFRDTGTWGDYFPPADHESEDPKLTVPSRPGRAQYQIDTDEDEAKK